MRDVITVAEYSVQPDGAFVARVSFPDAEEFELTVVDPAQAGDMERLAWYFEEHLRYPFLDRDLAEDAVQRLRSYGERLFMQLFGGPVNPAYRRSAERGFDGYSLRIRGSAAFHRLRWEALADPALSVPLAVRVPMVRRLDMMPIGFEALPPRTTLNILVVTARPGGSHDVGYRTISRPLLDNLRGSNRPVTVDLVRPGTWQALRNHLQDAARQHGAGYYQVIHFDVHGAVATFEGVQQRLVGDGYRFVAVEGDQVEFEGEGAFLFFETDSPGHAHPVSAADVAELLTEHRVPIAVLNSCQSAKEPASESSLAQRLVEAGVPVSIGMAYSVTVSAAEKVTPSFYAALARGDDPAVAMMTARGALFDDKSRRAYFGQQIDLEDWVLPVVFAGHDVQIDLREMPPERQAAFYQREAAIGSEPGTEYGFVGRDIDIHALERALLLHPEQNMVLLQGMAGAGKSTLLHHLAWWWQRTGLVERAFFFSYEHRPWTAGQIARDITRALLPPVEQARVDAMPWDAQIELVAGLLRGHRYLLVLDQIESISADPAMSPQALSEHGRQQLAEFLARMRGGASLVLLGSREPEGWLSRYTFSTNVYRLPGLDEQAASQLVDRILTRHGGDRHLSEETQRAALGRLTDMLGGYPLALAAILPTLATRPPTEVLADLQAGGDADPNRLISNAIEHSHGRLDPSTQKRALLLAPFTGAVPAAMLDRYGRLLADEDAVRELSPIDLAAVMAEIVRVGLAASHPHLSGYTQLLPLLPNFLRRSTQRAPGLYAATQRAHYRVYSELGAMICELLTSSDPQQRPVGLAVASNEYINLARALEQGISAEQPIGAIVEALDEYLDQSGDNDARRGLLDLALSAPRGTDHPEELAFLHHLAGIAAQDRQEWAEAEQHYRRSVEIRLTVGAGSSTGITYHQLGVVAQHHRRFDEATAHYRRALDLFSEDGDRLGAASTYGQLGAIAQQQRRFEEATAHHRHALDIFQALNDRLRTAATLAQLGAIAQQQWSLEEATEHYRRALDIQLELNERRGTAVILHELGTVAHDLGRLREAEARYRESLRVKLELDNRHGAALTYHQLGMVTQQAGRLSEAEGYCQQALALFREFGDRHGAALTCHQLGTVAQERQAFEAARTYLREALAQFTELGDQRSAASVHGQLGMVAQGLRESETSEAHYREALALFLEYDDPRRAALVYRQLGALAHDQNRLEEAEAHYLQAQAIEASIGLVPGAGVDVGILTVLEVEQQAVVTALRRLRGYHVTRPSANGPLVHRAEVGPADRPVRVAAVQVGTGTAGSARVAQLDLVRHLSPGVVLLVGIAGAVGKGVALGDVVLSDAVVVYDSRRVSADGVPHRGDEYVVSAPVRHRLDEFMIATDARVQGSVGEIIRVLRGTIGSALAVSTHESEGDEGRLLRSNENLLAVDMEAAGMVQVLQHAAGPTKRPYGWVTVRGISDTADSAEGHHNHERASSHAAAVAVELLAYLSFIDPSVDASVPRRS